MVLYCRIYCNDNITLLQYPSKILLNNESVPKTWSIGEKTMIVVSRICQLNASVYALLNQ